MKLHLRLGSKTIGWWFNYPHDGTFHYANLLPRALKAYEILSPSSAVDFLVLVYPTMAIPRDFAEFRGVKFMITAEPGQRLPSLENCYNIVNGEREDDPPCNRYGPLLSYWVPALTALRKTKFCSTIDSGKWLHRAKRIVELASRLPPMEIFGALNRNPIGGYHATDASDLFGNAKYRGIIDFAFYLSLESAQLMDYWTEKLGDATLCDAVPIYEGAPNIYDYFIPESIVPVGDIDKIDWKNWQAEYAGRQKYVTMQKELLLRRFNLFSYIDILTSDLSLLDRRRPIVR